MQKLPELKGLRDGHKRGVGCRMPPGRAGVAAARQRASRLLAKQEGACAYPLGERGKGNVQMVWVAVQAASRVASLLREGLLGRQGAGPPRGNRPAVDTAPSVRAMRSEWNRS